MTERSITREDLIEALGITSDLAIASESLPELTSQLAAPAKVEEAEFVVLDQLGEPLTSYDPLGPNVFVKFTKKGGEYIYEAVSEGLGRSLGYNAVNAYGGTYPLRLIGQHLGAIKNSLEEYGIDVSVDLGALFESYSDARRAQLAKNTDRGTVEFEDLQFVFAKNSQVIAQTDGVEVAGFVDDATMHHSFFGTYLEVKLRVVHSMKGDVEEGLVSVYQGAYAGARPYEELLIRFVDAAELARLNVRGEKFARFSGGARYAAYTGQLTRSNYRFNRTFKSDGRVMIDAATFSQVDNEQYRMEETCSDVSTRRQKQTKAAVTFELSKKDYWRTWPFVYGFSFPAKRWGRFDVSGLTDVNWRTGSWDQLVLKDELKELVRALVDHAGTSFGDIIEGKGGGTIFLLHGPPGQGKTLTAETIAERLKRPLYTISVGELGVDPDDLEKRLREILDVATTWNAVILIDEADIFLEQRNQDNIVRNAMVGVFLRLLEYHQGVLFLTTNRVKNIDEAFYSRISVALYFKDEGVSKRERIWTELLNAANVTGLDPKSLAAHDINGRQIKNVIRQSQVLAIDQNVPVSAAIVEHVIDLVQQFTHDVKHARGQE